MRILFLTARFPYPPIRGDALIPYHRLRLMGRKHDIDLLTFYSGKEELKGLEKLRPYCRKIEAVKRSLPGAMLNILWGILFTRYPFQVLLYRSRKFKKIFQKLIKDQQYDLIHVHILRIAEYARDIPIPRVLELIDSMQLNIERRLVKERFPLSWILRRELKRLRSYEPQIIADYDRAIVVAEADRQAIGSDRVEVVHLGVDQEKLELTPRLTREKRLAFTGSMFYFPNENAILWFMARCYPRIKSEVPEVKLVIAGNDPGPAIRKLADGDDISVTGFVPSMKEILHQARVAIAPMQSGSGMQFKILDAMACGIPVVATTLGLGAIRAKAGQDVLIADTAGDFSTACIRLLRDYDLACQIGQKGRRLVEGEYTWHGNVKKIERIYDSVTGEK